MALFWLAELIQAVMLDITQKTLRKHWLHVSDQYVNFHGAAEAAKLSWWLFKKLKIASAWLLFCLDLSANLMMIGKEIGSFI